MPGRQCWLWVICLLLLTEIPASCRAESAAAAAWTRKISAQIEAHKRFPPSVFGQTGEAKVMFLLDRSGNLISNNLMKSTGIPQLDAAALAMVANAQPFPPVPPEVFNPEFMLPIVFERPKSFDGKRMPDAKLMSDKYLVSGKYQVPDSDIPKDDDIMREQTRLNAKMRGICRGC